MKKVYSIRAPLGSGAFGEVKLAQNKVLLHSLGFFTVFIKSDDTLFIKLCKIKSLSTFSTAIKTMLHSIGGPGNVSPFKYWAFLLISWWAIHVNRYPLFARSLCYCMSFCTFMLIIICSLLCAGKCFINLFFSSASEDKFKFKICMTSYKLSLVIFLQQLEQLTYWVGEM